MIVAVALLPSSHARYGYNSIGSHPGFFGASLQMSFLRAACAALVGQTGIRKRYRAVTFVPVLLLANVFLSCGSSSSSSAPNHIAYVSLPSDRKSTRLNSSHLGIS